MNSSEYPEEYYCLYAAFKNNEFYSVMLYTPLDKKSSSFDSDLTSFKTHSDSRLDTLKIK